MSSQYGVFVAHWVKYSGIFRLVQHVASNIRAGLHGAESCRCSTFDPNSDGAARTDEVNTAEKKTG